MGCERRGRSSGRDMNERDERTRQSRALCYESYKRTKEAGSLGICGVLIPKALELEGQRGWCAGGG
jgi:hypothetical protein